MKLSKIHHEQCDKKCKHRYNITKVKDSECERILFFYIKKKGVIAKRNCPHKRNGIKCVTACYTCEYAKKIGKKMFYHEFSAYCKLFNKNNVLCAYKALHHKGKAHENN